MVVPLARSGLLLVASLAVTLNLSLVAGAVVSATSQPDLAYSVHQGVTMRDGAGAQRTYTVYVENVGGPTVHDVEGAIRFSYHALRDVSVEAPVGVSVQGAREGDAHYSFVAGSLHPGQGVTFRLLVDVRGAGPGPFSEVREPVVRIHGEDVAAREWGEMSAAQKWIVASVGGALTTVGGFTLHGVLRWRKAKRRDVRPPSSAEPARKADPTADAESAES